MAYLETPPTPAVAASKTVTNGRWAGYRHLLGARMKELWREPEVIFWVFVFPLLLALGLKSLGIPSNSESLGHLWSAKTSASRNLHRCVVDVETALLQQLLNIAQRKRIARIPPDRTKYEAGFGLPPFEDRGSGSHFAFFHVTSQQPRKLQHIQVERIAI